MENLSLRIIQLLTVLALFKSLVQSLLWDSRQTLSYEPIKIKKSIKYIYYTMAQGKHFHSFQKGATGIEKNQTKTSLKMSRASIKSWSSMSSTQGVCWWDVTFEELRQPCPYSLASWSPHGFSLGLTLLIVCCFPQQTFHVTGISNFLGSVLHAWLHSHSLTYHFLRGTFLGLGSLSLKSWWKQLWHSAHHVPHG